MEKNRTAADLRNLKRFLETNSIKITKLAELAELSPTHLSKALCGTPDKKDGTPTTLSTDALQSLKFGVEQLAYEIGNLSIEYDEYHEEVKRNGCRYCKSCVIQIKDRLMPYMDILPFLQAALGWNRYKVLNVMNVTTSSSYGNISRSDCDSINCYLKKMADDFKTIQIA